MRHYPVDRVQWPGIFSSVYPVASKPLVKNANQGANAVQAFQRTRV